MHYIDASAFVKLIKREKESEALFKALPRDLISSQILQVEVMRTVAEMNNAIVIEARKRLDQISYFEVNNEVIRTASFFGNNLSSKAMDSIHLATSHLLGGKLRGLITYDKTMIADAKLLGIPVLSPT